MTLFAIRGAIFRETTAVQEKPGRYGDGKENTFDPRLRKKGVLAKAFGVYALPNLFANSCLYLEEVYRKAMRTAPDTSDSPTKDPVMVAAGKKAAITRATASYTVDQHFHGKPEYVRDLAQKVKSSSLVWTLQSRRFRRNPVSPTKSARTSRACGSAIKRSRVT